MDFQFLFEPRWKSRYIQMLISCGIDKSDALILARSMRLVEDVTQNDVCNLTPEQATIADETIKETYTDQYKTVIAYLYDYIGWRKLFEPYMEQPLQREEIINSKEMVAIKDVPLSPDDLEAIIVTAFGDKTINVAAPGLALAWMGYEVPDMTQIKDSDFDFDKHTLRGAHVPDSLWRVLKRYHDTDSEKVQNGGNGRWIYKIHGDWFLKSTDSRKTTTECQVDPKKVPTAVKNMTEKYRQIAGRERKITLRLTKEAGTLYRLYEPWDGFTDEKFVEALRFERRAYVSYQMQGWRKRFTAYCFLREMGEAT